MHRRTTPRPPDKERAIPPPDRITGASWRSCGDYVCTRVWQLKPGVSVRDVEALASSGMVEILSWIPGVKGFSLCRLLGEPRGYLMSMSFVDYGSYKYWRQVEEEAADYWEHFAAVLAQWEQLCQLVEEYAGDRVIDVAFEEKIQEKS